MFKSYFETIGYEA
ncbi:hypothetical protein vcoNHCC006C_003353A, partial [Vibrio cholerae O1 str. NHCC-006C]